MFHKIRWLHKKGVAIYLHCFTYDERVPTEELNKYCKEVYYYKRKTGLVSLMSLLPYNVKSRISKELKQNLMKNDFPVILEALHSCFLLKDDDFKDRIKIFRESNIEHEYFFHLAKHEKQFFKQIYFLSEAFKLKTFEKVLSNADLILTVSKADESYFSKLFPSNKVKNIPSFHQNDEVHVVAGSSDYILYHGNLAVSENYMAAEWLVENVFSKIKQRSIIAGLDPPAFLAEKIAKYPHISLVENCTREQMDELVENAHVHCLYTPQATGLKLKLLNVLFKGRFVIVNENMLHGTSLNEACIIANSPNEYIELINSCFTKKFEETDVKMRESLLNAYSNDVNAVKLISLINELKYSKNLIN